MKPGVREMVTIKTEASPDPSEGGEKKRTGFYMLLCRQFAILNVVNSTISVRRTSIFHFQTFFYKYSGAPHQKLQSKAAELQIICRNSAK